MVGFIPYAIDKNTNEIKKSLQNKGLDVYVVGTGTNIVGQYPQKGICISKGSKVFLLTSKMDDINIPNMNDWSKKDASTYCTIAKINCNFEGNGYVKSQTIKGKVKYNERRT